MRQVVAILIRSLPLFVGMASASAQLLFQYDLPGNLISRSPQVTGLPVILRQPAMQVVGPGRTASFSVVVADSFSVNYQWRFEGTNISGATKDALLLTNATAASEGNYSVVVANAGGSVTSAPAMLYWDSVGDGLPDSWKIQYFGSITNVNASSDAPLHDGVSNLQKFLDGTNPTNGVGLRPRLTLAGLNGSAAASPDLDKYNLGQQISVTATPHSSFQFVGWSGDIIGTNNPATVTMNASKSITAVCSLPLPYTLDTTNITWRSGGDVPWFGQDLVTYDGLAAAQNGPLGNNQVSWLEATVYMPADGTLTFWWKRIPSAGRTLTLSINGVSQSGQVPNFDWSQATYYLPAGADVIRWSYAKSFEGNQGFDAYWVDQVAATVYADPLADSDNDGLPDLWEYHYFGHLRDLGTKDADNDRVNNHDEYLDGTDPTLATSVRPQLTISASGGTVGVSPSLVQYSYLQAVTLTATPNAGFTFIGWSGDLSGSTNPATLTMDRSKTVTALFAVSAPDALAEALDATNLSWSTGGDASFFDETLVTHDGVDAAQSPPLGPNQQSWFQTTVNGPGPLSFWWKSSGGFGQMQLLVNGVQQRSLSGSTDWQQVSLNLASGANTLRWSFSKGTFAFAPNDAAWVDQVVFGTNVPSITSAPVSKTVLQGSNTTFTVTAVSSSALSYQWQKNGVNLTDGGSVSGAATAALTLGNVQPNDSGTYSVLVSTASATVSSAASLTVNALVPLEQALDTPSWAWTSGGNSVWLGQNLVNHDGSDAAQAGNILGQQESWLETTVTGPGALNFWWKVSCTERLNHFEYIADGVTNATISGEVDWVPRSFLLSPGSHTVRWRYIQNYFSSFVVQGAWLDQISFIPGVPPTITGHPVSQSVSAGANVTFSVTATGAAPLSYQWLFNHTNVIGSNSATLTLSNVQLANAGAYSVIVSNPLGKITSAAADLIVNVPPYITSQPSGATGPPGTNITLSVIAGGALPLYYQWRKDGTDLPGSTQPSLLLSGAQPGDSGNYNVVITNWLGSITSAVARVIVGLPPSITTQPVDQNANVGSTVTFSVVAAGTAPLYYQWRENGFELPGKTNPTLVLTNVQFSDSGVYDVVITNALGSVTSYAALLSLNFGTPPYIITQPASQTVQPGGSVSFTVFASGDPPLDYQWRKNGTNLPGATAFSLQLTNVQTSDAGPYTVVISNSVGSVTSDVAVLTVGSASLTLSITVSNSVANLDWNSLAGRSYQVEYKTDLATAAWSNLPPMITATGSNVAVSDLIGDSQRRFYRVGLLPQTNAPPQILVQPVSQIVSAGANVIFSVTATGSQPLHYQWQMNGTDLIGATAATLSLQNVQSGDIGIYSVVVNNFVDSVMSDAAFLFVQ